MVAGVRGIINSGHTLENSPDPRGSEPCSGGTRWPKNIPLDKAKEGAGGYLCLPLPHFCQFPSDRPGYTAGFPLSQAAWLSEGGLGESEVCAVEMTRKSGVGGGWGKQ